MGVLTVDVTGFGVVMSADSNPVEALDGETKRLAHPGQWHTRNPIVRRDAGGYTGFTGFVGTETIDGKGTRDWLEGFGRRYPSEGLADYISALGQELTDEWNRLGLPSVLEILVSGVENGEVRFAFVRNSDGLYPDGTYRAPKATFDAVNDLDQNYIGPLLAKTPGLTKEEHLRTRMYSFRQGALLPAAGIFDVFRDILGTLYANGIAGFTPMTSVDDLGSFVRQRLEFVKRLYSKKHGIYRDPSPPIGGKVHVVGVGLDGGVAKYSKIR